MPGPFRKEACQWCRFYRGTSGLHGEGKCNRFPPVLVQPVLTETLRELKDKPGGPTEDDVGEALESPYVWATPRVYAFSYCGEYRPREVK